MKLNDCFGCENIGEITEEFGLPLINNCLALRHSCQAGENP